MQNEMIQLTIANTLDQTAKQRVEVQGNQTLKQVVQQRNLAPNGSFDVYDQVGKVITNQAAANHRDATVYVGVAKVAGGAIPGGLDLDDDDDGWDLDDDMPPVKPREVIFILPSGERQAAQPNDGELLIQTYQRAIGAPRDGTPMEVYDANGQAVSNFASNDMIGRAFHVGPRRFIGGGMWSAKDKAKQQASARFGRQTVPAYPALVPKEIIEQTTAFTQPRGRLEMGGLLIGHIDHDGNNVVVCGFFPRQDEATSGYCEFDGSFNAIAAAACDYANEKAGGSHTPSLRIIGWIHTHPDIGIFLSGIDINTFGMLRESAFQQRCVAVVVDPLRKQHGVFISERKAQNKDAEQADATVKLSEDLEARYHKFLNRMRSFQQQRGKGELPFLMPGILYHQRNAMGDQDDIMEAKIATLDKLTQSFYRQQADYQSFKGQFQEHVVSNRQAVNNIESDGRQTKESFQRILAALEREVQALRGELDAVNAKIPAIESREIKLKKKLKEVKLELSQISKEKHELLERVNVLEAKEKEQTIDVEVEVLDAELSANKD